MVGGLNMMKGETSRVYFRLHNAIQTINMVFLEARVDPLQPVNQFLAVQLKSSVVSRLIENYFFLLVDLYV